MPKLKTKKAAAKRFSITATGKIKYKKPGLRHNTGHKARWEKAQKRHAGYLFTGDAQILKGTLPYGLK